MAESKKKLRVVVELSLPATTLATEKDLQEAVMKSLPAQLSLKRSRGSLRVKLFGQFWPMFLKAESGTNHFRTKEE